MGTSWISRKERNLEKEGVDLEKGGMNPLTNYAVATLRKLCSNKSNSSNVAWCLSGRQRIVKDLIALFFNTGINDCKYFAHLIKL